MRYYLKEKQYLVNDMQAVVYLSLSTKPVYGTSSERGEQFRSRVLSVVETCKKRKISAFEVISSIVGAVIRREPYPDVFNLLKI